MQDSKSVQRKVSKLSKHEQNIYCLMRRRRLQILVHSYIYYEMNDNIIDDSLYDKWCKELAELQNDYPHISEIGMQAYNFQGFDGSTGFDLEIDDGIKLVAVRLYTDYKKRNALNDELLKEAKCKK